MAKIELFYDIVSPYSYLAFSCLERYRERWSLELVMRPAFLGGVMKEVGNTPPAYLPQRAPYLVRDLGRLSRYFGVDLMIPEDFPTNTLQTMRFVTAVRLDRPALLTDVSRALWRWHWGKGKSVSTIENIVEGSGLSASDAAPFVEKMSAPETKAALKQTGDEAIERGVFGFPAMFTDIDGNNELFFGSDRINVMASELGLEWHGPDPRP